MICYICYLLLLPLPFRRFTDYILPVCLSVCLFNHELSLHSVSPFMMFFFTESHEFLLLYVIYYILLQLVPSRSV